MTVLQVSAILLGLTALLFSLNQHFLRLPNSIGVMLLALGISVILAVLQWFGMSFVRDLANTLLNNIDLNAAVINGFLCLLLFAGAMHVDAKRLYKERFVIGLLATGGVVISTIIVGLLTWTITSIFGLQVPLVYCFIFGALISPTDAVTVLLFLRNSSVPNSLESKITGESLMNDGMSIVLFGSLLAISTGSIETNLATLPFAVLIDIVGALMIGTALGWITSMKIKHAPANNRYIGLLTTLALATGSYALADAMGVSGPIAVVAAGLFIGSASDVLCIQKDDMQLLHDAWDLIDEILSSILFVIIGLELLSISTQYSHVFVAVLLIPVTLAARYASIYSTLKLFPRLSGLHPMITNILTWGGLRGGISIALVLSLPAGETRDILMTATYAVVLFSVFVQGPTLNKVISTQKLVMS